tara:strand:- start:83522 stop:85918 length:2397 start_codon:yes stop_codon:yes gene_type:complete
MPKKFPTRHFYQPIFKAGSKTFLHDKKDAALLISATKFLKKPPQVPVCDDYIGAVLDCGVSEKVLDPCRRMVLLNFFYNVQRLDLLRHIKRLHLPIWGNACANALNACNLKAGSLAFYGNINHEVGYVKAGKGNSIPTAKDYIDTTFNPFNEGLTRKNGFYCVGYYKKSDVQHGANYTDLGASISRTISFKINGKSNANWQGAFKSHEMNTEHILPLKQAAEYDIPEFVLLNQAEGQFPYIRNKENTWVGGYQYWTDGNSHNITTPNDNMLAYGMHHKYDARNGAFRSQGSKPNWDPPRANLFLGSLNAGSIPYDLSPRKYSLVAMGHGQKLVGPLHFMLRYLMYGMIDPSFVGVCMDGEAGTPPGGPPVRYPIDPIISPIGPPTTPKNPPPSELPAPPPHENNPSEPTPETPETSPGEEERNPPTPDNPWDEIVIDEPPAVNGRHELDVGIVYPGAIDKNVRRTSSTVGIAFGMTMGTALKKKGKTPDGLAGWIPVSNQGYPEQHKPKAGRDRLRYHRGAAFHIRRGMTYVFNQDHRSREKYKKSYQGADAVGSWGWHKDVEEQFWLKNTEFTLIDSSNVVAAAIGKDGKIDMTSTYLGQGTSLEGKLNKIYEKDYNFMWGVGNKKPGGTTPSGFDKDWDDLVAEGKLAELPSTFGDGSYTKSSELTEDADAHKFTKLVMPTKFEHIAPYIRIVYMHKQFFPAIIYVDKNHPQVPHIYGTQRPIGTTTRITRAPIGGYLILPRFNYWWLKLIEAQPVMENFILYALGNDYHADNTTEMWYSGDEFECVEGGTHDNCW